MVRISDRQLDIALRFALQDCYEEEIEAMDAIDPADYPVSKKTKRRFKRALDRAMRQETWNFSIPRPLKKAAVVVLVVAAVLFTAMMATPTVRAAVWDVVVKWYDRYIGVVFNQEASPAIIEEIVMPAELPNGWKIETITTSIGMAEHIVTTQDERIIYISQFAGDEESWVDNTDVSIKSVTLANGVKGQFFQNDDCITLIWQDRYIFIIRGELGDETEILFLANSMTKD